MLILLGLAPAVTATAQDGAESAIRQAETRRFQALVQQDTGALTPLLGDDLTYVHTNGKRDTKRTLLDAVRSGQLVYEEITPQETHVRVFDDMAVVTGRIWMRAGTRIQMLGFSLTYTSVYVRRQNRWLLVAWQSTRSS